MRPACREGRFGMPSVAGSPSRGLQVLARLGARRTPFGGHGRPEGGRQGVRADVVSVGRRGMLGAHRSRCMLFDTRSRRLRTPGSDATRKRLAAPAGSSQVVGSKCAPVAQMDRAPGFEPVGRGFKSLRARQRGQHSPPPGIRLASGSWIQAPVAQLDRASASGAEGHRFESCRARQVPAQRRRRGTSGRREWP